MAIQKKAKVKSSNIHKHVTEVLKSVGSKDLSTYGTKSKKTTKKKARVLKDSYGTFKEMDGKTKKGMVTITG